MAISWESVGRSLADAAPYVGSLLAGPAGGAVGALIAQELGTGQDPASVAAALAGNPEAAARVRELELNARVQLQQLAVTATKNQMDAEQAVFAAEVADRDSARKLAAQQQRDWIRPFIVVVLLAGAIGIAACVFMFADQIHMDAQSALTAGTVLGFWFNELKQVLGFYFGSTKDSNQQVKTITQFAIEDGAVTSEVKK